MGGFAAASVAGAAPSGRFSHRHAARLCSGNGIKLARAITKKLVGTNAN
jgi:hypothetical protein